MECTGICRIGTFDAGCKYGEIFPFFRCELCHNKPDVNNSLYIEGKQCPWECVDGYFRTENAQCQAWRSEPCPVGLYLTPGTESKDRECEPCDASYNYLHTSGGQYTSDSCNQKCISSLFSSLEGCESCDSGSCGQGKDNTRFTFDGFMVTQPCTDVADSKCVACDSGESVMKSGGEFACDYDCQIGYFAEPHCGVWNEHGDVHFTTGLVEVKENTSIELQFLDNDLHLFQTDTNAPTIVFLLEGRIKIRAQTHLSNVAVQVTENDGDNTEVLSMNMTAQVQSGIYYDKENTGNVWQKIRSVWSTNKSNTWQPPSVRFMAEQTTFDLEVSVHVQIQQRCVFEAYACAQCEAALLPANATFVVSDNCSWICSTDYKLHEDVCIFCPDLLCSVGMYMADCGVCEACESTDKNIRWLSAGEYKQKDSCDYECVTDFFNNFGVCTQCSLNLTCESDQFLAGCEQEANAKCTTCTRCILGLATQVVCNGTTDTQCSRCENSLPDLAHWVDQEYIRAADATVLVPECYWECGEGSFHDTVRGICRFCDDVCVVGQYYTQCTVENEFSHCMACNIPDNAIATSVGRTLPDSCAWECDENTTVVVLESGIFACVVVVPPAPPVGVDLCQNVLECEVGHVYSTIACKCVECSDVLDSSSRAVFTTKGSCMWVCKHPFIKVNTQCEILSVSSKNSGADNFNSDASTIAWPNMVLTWLSILPFLIIFVMASYSLLR